MKSHRQTTLANVSESVRYGYTASATQDEIGPRFLRITDIVPDSIKWESVPYCAIDVDDRDRFALRPGDIVVARTGATVGYAKLIREPVDAVFASYLVRFRVDPSKANPAFIGHMVESSAYKRFVLSHVGGAAQPNANAQVLGKFEFSLPSLQSQERVAQTLSAYDDLMENNRRRMALLEESARLLYREWFVHLRFPGHEHTRLI
ncbi:MAG: restriction endonuclease subunit S, partial [Verrucomicrobiaceae bacterium]|nr:restriction endonuclease subunit S [Verrucomicrobiaceae bacterium]